MADNEAQVELKKRARRRLVGASALALAAAIILPMVMDGEPKRPASDLQIRIPSQEGGNFASRMITGTAQAPSAPELPVSSSARPTQSTPAPHAAQSAGEIAARAEAKPETDAAPAKPQELPITPKSEPQQTPVPKDAARAQAILEGKAETPKPAGKYFVQAGVYRDANNAHDVLEKAKANGVKLVAEKLGDKTRVRGGPFADKAAADAAAAKLKKAGIAGIVTSK